MAAQFLKATPKSAQNKKSFRISCSNYLRRSTTSLSLAAREVYYTDNRFCFLGVYIFVCMYINYTNAMCMLYIQRTTTYCKNNSRKKRYSPFSFLLAQKGCLTTGTQDDGHLGVCIVDESTKNSIYPKASRALQDSTTQLGVGSQSKYIRDENKRAASCMAMREAKSPRRCRVN